MQRLASELRARGTLHVLRKGIKANGCRFQLVYFIPSSGLNYDLLNLYGANLFSEIRQLHYSEKNNKGNKGGAGNPPSWKGFAQEREV